jgi:hypothetical protein
MTATLDARAELTFALARLRYASQCPAVPLTVPTDTEEDFLHAVIAWVGELGNTLDYVASLNTAMIEELRMLRDQRSSIRAFLGTSPVIGE